MAATTDERERIQQTERQERVEAAKRIPADRTKQAKLMRRRRKRELDTLPGCGDG
jgi:hypothetical protein